MLMWSYIVEKIPHVEDELAEVGHECAVSESCENSYLWMLVNLTRPVLFQQQAF